MSPYAVRYALRDRAETGLLDVRPEGRFAAGHPLFAASFPLGRLEAEVFGRPPRRSVRWRSGGVPRVSGGLPNQPSGGAAWR